MSVAEDVSVSPELPSYLQLALASPYLTQRPYSLLSPPEWNELAQAVHHQLSQTRESSLSLAAQQGEKSTLDTLVMKAEELSDIPHSDTAHKVYQFLLHPINDYAEQLLEAFQDPFHASLEQGLGATSVKDVVILRGFYTEALHQVRTLLEQGAKQDDVLKAIALVEQQYQRIFPKPKPSKAPLSE